MKILSQNKRAAQQGYLLLVAVILIMVIGFLGIITSYLFYSNSLTTTNLLQGNNSLYTAESGLEEATRYLLTPIIVANGSLPIRSTCTGISSVANLTNASFSSPAILGTFKTQTVSAAGVVGTNSFISANTTINGQVNPTDAVINVVNASSFAPSGRIMIDKELINYAGRVGSGQLYGLERGAGFTIPSSHAAGAYVTQLQCTLDVKAGIPTIAAPVNQRELQQSVQLQEAWGVGTVSGTNLRFSRWNQPTEKVWTLTNIAGTATTAATLNAISVISNGDGWAVGNGINSQYTLYREVGPGNWTRNAVTARCNGTKSKLNGVSTVSSKEAWAVGVTLGNGGGTNCSGTTRRYMILKWNGTAWTTLAPTTIPADNTANKTLQGVSVVDTTGTGTGNEGFAVGLGGTILEYNGTTWVNDTQSKIITVQDLYAVQTMSTTEAWAAGGIGNNTGVILKWTSGTWTIAASGLARSIRAISMLADTGSGVATSGWACGLNGLTFTYNGTTWSAGTTLPGALQCNAIMAFSPTDVWASGTGTNAFHWDGTSWSTFTVGVTGIMGMSSVSPSRLPTAGWNEVIP